VPLHMKMNPAGDAAAVETAPGWALSSAATSGECVHLCSGGEAGAGGEDWLALEVAGAEWLVGGGCAR
jgi:hypothetical protein